MDNSYKFVIIQIILISTVLNISGCSSPEGVHTLASTEETGEFYSLVLSQSSTETPDQNSELFTDFTPATTTTTTTKKLASSTMMSVSSTVSSYQGTTETQQSTAIFSHLLDVTRLLTSLSLSTSPSSPLKSSSTHISPHSSSSDFFPTTFTLVPSVSLTSDSVASTEDLSTSSLHIEVSKGEQSHSSPEKIAGIVAGAACSVIALVVIMVAAFYFKRRRKSVVENINMNYESEKFEDINDIDYDIITLTDSHYEKVQSANSRESQYTMIVRVADNGQAAEEKVPSIEDSSSYVLQNEFGAVPGVRVEDDNGVTNSYENKMFSLDIKDDFLPIQAYI